MRYLPHRAIAPSLVELDRVQRSLQFESFRSCPRAYPSRWARTVDPTPRRAYSGWTYTALSESESSDDLPTDLNSMQTSVLAVRTLRVRAGSGADAPTHRARSNESLSPPTFPFERRQSSLGFREVPPKRIEFSAEFYERPTLISVDSASRRVDSRLPISCHPPAFVRRHGSCEGERHGRL